MHVLLFVIFVLPAAIRLLVAIVSPEKLKSWEGKRARQLIEDRFGTLQKNSLIDEVGNRLSKHTGVQATFFLSPNKMVNAGALPDGTVIIWKGLFLKTAGRPDMLAGVLAHELGHLKHDHYLRQLYWVVLIQFVLGVFARPLVGVLSRNIAGRILNMGFSRFRERQADDEAILIMKEAGFNPQGLIDLFSELASYSGPMAFLGTHPDPQERADRIREQLGLEKDEKEERKPRNVIPFPLRNDQSDS